jgi:hypothetical protein
VGKFYAVANAYGSCPESEEWFGTPEEAEEEAVNRAPEEGEMLVIEVTTKILGRTKVTFVKNAEGDSW